MPIEMLTPAAALYRGRIRHARSGDVEHRLGFGFFALCADLERLGEVERDCRLFGHGRARPVMLRAKDHGPRDGFDLAVWAREALATRGLGVEGPVTLFAMPRLFGRSFNPLALYVGHDRAGTPRSALCHVSNMRGERHLYAFPLGPARASAADIAKNFHVSPLLGEAGCYRFRLAPPRLSGPERTVRLTIDYRDRQGRRLLANLDAVRHPLTDATLAAGLLRWPFQGLAVEASILWHAGRIWAKGGRAGPDQPTIPLGAPPLHDA